jgi:hypothetical protein
MSSIRLVLVNIAVLLCLGGSLEVGARLLYPEFAGHIHSASKTMGVEFHMADFHGFAVRVPTAGPITPTGKPLVIVLGDSISNGYGTAYEDIWWVRLQRLLAARGRDNQFVSIAGYGNNLADSNNAIKKLAREADLPVSRVIYQFNFNDVTPYSSADLKRPGETLNQENWFKAVGRWRYEYANHSVFLRVTQHVGGIVIRKTSGTCEERGLDALGPYTWTFGSRPFREDSEKLWAQFESNLADLKQTSDGIGARLEVFVSPLIFDVDPAGHHPYFNSANLDLTCGTIDARARLASTAKRLGIQLFDPAMGLRRSFDSRLAEGNFSPYFFVNDENHFTPLAASYIAEQLAEAMSPQAEKR